ncbi:MAG TPA: TetR family transcriptional regulator, partial [Kofleriaceae bacterium]|nr:TetR family transcriptional regulator [Kofleriaceae bacterium]
MNDDSTEADAPRGSAVLRAMARKVYRDGILEAAEKVFARAGFADTRMADVAAEAGLATGTLYNYFANRDELLSSLIERRGEDLLAALREAEERASEPREQLEELARAVFGYFESHRPLFAIFLEPGSISGKSMAAITRRCGSAQREFYGLFTRIIER